MLYTVLLCYISKFPKYSIYQGGELEVLVIKCLYRIHEACKDQKLSNDIWKHVLYFIGFKSHQTFHCYFTQNGRILKGISTGTIWC